MSRLRVKLRIDKFIPIYYSFSITGGGNMKHSASVTNSDSMILRENLAIIGSDAIKSIESIENHDETSDSLKDLMHDEKLSNEKKEQIMTEYIDSLKSNQKHTQKLHYIKIAGIVVVVLGVSIPLAICCASA